MAYELRRSKGLAGDPRYQVAHQGTCDKPRADRPSGVLGFHDMLAALERGDWPAARAAALDSDWARETPARARRVADALVK